MQIKHKNVTFLAVTVILTAFFAQSAFAIQKMESPKTNITDAETIGTEGSYISSAGAISDGESIWTIPYEPNSFSKINITTGQKEDLSAYSSYAKLNKLSGYMSGAYYEDNNGGRFIYLAPFDVSTPLARIDLDTMQIDHPVRNVGYYFGSCQITSQEGNDYLWLFPSKTKPFGVSTETEIVKVNLTDCKKEGAYPTKTDNGYVSFANTVKAGDYIWLLPNETGQPLIRLDTATFDGNLNSNSVTKIFSSDKMKFSRIPTALFDGTHMWFVCEDISFMFKESILARCNADGSFIDSQILSKDNYTASATDGNFLYLFSGAEGCTPSNIKINFFTGEKTEFSTTNKKSFIPANAFVSEANSLVIIPKTKDGLKKPVISVLPSPKINVTADTERKLYRDFGDMATGVPIDIELSAPAGFSGSAIYTFSADPSQGEVTTKDTFEYAFGNSSYADKIALSSGSTDRASIFADKNGAYHFMAEFSSFDNDENKIYALGSVTVDNIFERLPITVSRYDIENGSDDALFEETVYKKDFGAAFAYNGGEFIKTDSPMEIRAAKTVEIGGTEWVLESAGNYTVSLSDDDISPYSFSAEMDLSYRAEITDRLDENNILDESIVVSNMNWPSNKDDSESQAEWEEVSAYEKHLSYDRGEGAYLQSALEPDNAEDLAALPTFEQSAGYSAYGDEQPATASEDFSDEYANEEMFGDYDNKDNAEMSAIYDSRETDYDYTREHYIEIFEQNGTLELP